MKNRTLLTIVLALTAVMLFFVTLNSGKVALRQQEALLASAQAPTEALDASGAEQIKAVDDEIMSPQTPITLKYQRYPTTFTYFVATEKSIPVYSSPNDDKRVIRIAEHREKLNYLETVILSGDAGASGDQIWYHIYWYEGEDGQDETDGEGGTVLNDGSRPGAVKRFGFIPEGSAEKRRIRLDTMVEYLKKADAFAAEGDIAHIANYKNGHGKPPLYRGAETDAQGNSRSQSAPGYPDPENRQEFTYLADGTLVKVLEKGNGSNDGGRGSDRKVLCLADGKTYYVPLRYLPDPHTLTALTKAVIIDRKNQNEASFEKVDGVWTCVSYSLATTGKKGEYAAPTPLGYYQMIEKRPQFYYYKDGTTEISGYAPFVMRFSGGAYIHGVPVTYQYKDGKRITPPHIEYSTTMGTIPLSHKCVRNYTSHAEFLYNWFEEGKTAVIVME